MSTNHTKLRVVSFASSDRSMSSHPIVAAVSKPPIDLRLLAAPLLPFLAAVPSLTARSSAADHGSQSSSRGRRRPTGAASRRRRRSSRPSIAAPPMFPSPVAAAIIADGCSAATPNGGRRQTPDAAVSPSPESRAVVARASSWSPSLEPPSPSFQPPSPFAQRPPAAVDCSAASRCSSPSSCRSATVTGVRHRRRIRPLPRVDIAGRLTSTPD
ncbi:unnamed protein product [Cuscuta campestris]|uniref:Uncharacterized protein n=1 Tax=Cuscuta campestris TaxID=132261 RepID=A0A484MXH6_9ASTE|nr:unnamed protein product [Cuscuta campestris]